MSSVIFITKTGDDGTGDGSAGNPYLTITQGITVANPGDEISVGDGTYSEILSINKSISLYSTSGDKSTVTITSTGKTVVIAHSTNNVTIRNLTIVTTSTADEAIAINVNKDFSVNPSGLPIVATLCENIVIQGCQITFNKTAMTVNAKDSFVKECTFTQVGATSSYTVFLVYTIDNFSILENTHTTATANMNRFIYLATTGGGDYRRNTFAVKYNTVTIATVALGHFVQHEMVLAHPSGDKLSMDIRNNTFTTTQASTGGLVLLNPTSSGILQNTLSTTNISVIADNQVINPYRGYLYVDISVATPSPMGSTYFSIYDNSFTGTKSQRPFSYDVDGETIVLVSTTPASTTGWVDIYNSSPKVLSISAPVDETDALNILKTALQVSYPGESLSVPLSLFSLTNTDDTVLLNPIIHESASILSDTDAGTFTVSVTNPNPEFKYVFQVLDTAYKPTDTLSFVVKVYNTLTNELVSTNLNAELEFVLGAGLAGKTVKVYRYDHPDYTLLDTATETIVPGTYTYTLNTNSLYSLQVEEEEPMTAISDYFGWIVFGLLVLVAGYVILRRPSKK